MEHLRPVERNLAAELDEVVGTEDGDEEHGVAHGNRPPLIPKTRGAPMHRAPTKFWLDSARR
ncbi:hypothetical protein GQ600_21591 [Phytophthora cactorum]|nr:hypothetical protein GQ600_21591 [Phytophthora cactorum]